MFDRDTNRFRRRSTSAAGKVDEVTSTEDSSVVQSHTPFRIVTHLLTEAEP